MYSEKSKIPWSALVVVIAVVVFGCIIVSTLVIRNLSLTSLVAPKNTTATPEAPKGSIVVNIDSSNTKEDWMNAVVDQFNKEQHKIASGEVIFVKVSHVTSGGSQQAILDGKSKPVVWSPGDQSWIDSLNQVWKDRSGNPLIPDACPPSILAPIGFAMWRPMAEALGWPDKPIHWEDLIALAANPDGWGSLGHPEWGQFKFGHTHPDYSNTGLLMLTSLAYATAGKTTGLTAPEVYADQTVQAFTKLEQDTYHYGIQNRPLMQVLAQRGPDYLHAVTSSEAEALKTNVDFAKVLRFQLVFIFPAGGTYWSEQPYCIVDADWVSKEQHEAAGNFRDYLLGTDRQAMAINYYLRPVQDNIPLHAPLALENGTDPRVTRSTVPPLESPSADVAAAVKDVFHQTKKKATVILVLDVSGSMEGDKIKNAVDSSVSFVQRMDKNDEIYATSFGGSGINNLGGGRAGDTSESLSKTLNGMFSSGGTPLYDAVCQAVTEINTLQADHDKNNERRLYGIVVLSDGQDTASKISESQMFNCLPTGESVAGVKIFTIAYGEDADKDLMLRIANRTNGKTFTGDPDSIEQIYNAISAEQ